MWKLRGLIALSLGLLTAGAFCFQQATAQFGVVKPLIGAAAPVSCGNDAFTKILLTFDGADGATTFVDSAEGQTGGPGTRSWSNPGAFVVSETTTVAPKFGTASGWFLPVSGGRIVAADSADFTLSSGNWTVDFWVNRNSSGTGATRWLFGQLSAASGLPANNAIGGSFTAANVLSFFVSSGGTVHTLTGGTAITNTAWNHVAFVRNGGTVTLYLNGAVQTSAAVSGSVPDIALDWQIGNRGDGSTNNYLGMIDEFRFSVGIARWTTTFTPPTTAYCQ